MAAGELGVPRSRRDPASRDATIGRPRLGHYLTEPSRGAAELAALLLAAPWLARAPRGDGHPVLVLPGLLASDRSTIALRRFLSRLGYRVQGWQLGRNVGRSAVIADALPAALDRLAGRGARPVTVIGWSLGGVYARDLARRSPHLVRQVITLGSPFAMSDPSQSRISPAVRRRAQRNSVHRSMPTSVPVPASAIYSRSDGIVAWQTCRDRPGPCAENIAVRGSHVGLGHNPAVLWVLADRLAQPSGRWQPFVAPPLLRALYPADRETIA
jgi:pimeloyl-ACP methyl ester carboxylesterase